MQNQVLNFAKKILKSRIRGRNNLVKGFLNCSQQKGVFQRLFMHTEAYDFNRHHSGLTLLPGGGLGKLQGRFKEEQYFNANDHLLLDKLRQTGCRLKCENSDSDWSEFERMANACGTLYKYKNYAEESFFLQEQKSLLERILDALKRLILNRRSGPPMSYGPPYGGFYPPFGGPQYHHSHEGKKTDEDEKEKDEQSKDDKEEEVVDGEGKEEGGQEQNDDDAAEEKPFEEEPFSMPPEDSYEQPPDNGGRNDGGDERQ